MNMPKDTNGPAPEDVEAHIGRQKRDVQGEQPGRLRDADDDVEAHIGRQKRDAEGEQRA
jgi:hypothetical protein